MAKSKDRRDEETAVTPAAAEPLASSGFEDETPETEFEDEEPEGGEV
jgi:hypothetical protein